MSRRDAVKTVHAVLRAWQSGDSLKAFSLFEDERKSPPIYNLSSYQVTQKEFYKREGANWAKIRVILDFPAESIFPSGKEWTFELSNSLFGWKITEFYQVANQGLETPL